MFRLIENTQYYRVNLNKRFINEMKRHSYKNIIGRADKCKIGVINRHKQPITTNKCKIGTHNYLQMSNPVLPV